MTSSVLPLNPRLIRAHTSPFLHDNMSPNLTPDILGGFSPLRPLPTPPNSASSGSTHTRSSSIRPLPAVPNSRSTTPEISHSRNGSCSSTSTYSDYIDSSPSLRDISVIPPSLRPGALKGSAPNGSSSHLPSDILFDAAPIFPRSISDLRTKKERALSPPFPSQSKKRRPQLQLKIEPSSDADAPEPPAKRPTLELPNLKRRSSLDSQTRRTPCLLSPDQALSPVVSRRRRKSSQPPSTMMVLSTALRNANTNAARLSSLPSAEKRASLQSSDDEDDLVSIPRSPLLFNLCESPENAPFPPTKALNSPLSTIKKGFSQDDNFHKFSQPPLSPMPFAGGHWASIQVTEVIEEDSSSSDSEDEEAGRKSGGCLPSFQELKLPQATCSHKKNTTVTTTLFKQLKKPRSAKPSSQETVTGAIAQTKEKRRTSSKIASRMWFKEKGGKRWEERDLEEVLCELRKLR